MESRRGDDDSCCSLQVFVRTLFFRSGMFRFWLGLFCLRTREKLTTILYKLAAETCRSLFGSDHAELLNAHATKLPNSGGYFT